jgi:hypothetical protein
MGTYMVASSATSLARKANGVDSRHRKLSICCIVYFYIHLFHLVFNLFSLFFIRNSGRLHFPPHYSIYASSNLKRTVPSLVVEREKSYH